MKMFVVYRQGLKNQIMSQIFRQKNRLSTLGEGIYQHIKKINPKTNTNLFLRFEHFCRNWRRRSIRDTHTKVCLFHPQPKSNIKIIRWNIFQITAHSKWREHYLQWLYHLLPLYHPHHRIFSLCPFPADQ